MSSRQQIDSVIDDDDEFCPLCIEEFDLSDKNFKPCPCGYQICQFCYNNIKTHSDEGRCPNCRRTYDDSTIQYKIPDAEEFKADLALKHRKAAAAKKKEAEKREIEASSRKNLAGVRVVQKNLVYVIGLNPTIRDENQLLQTLRGKEYFGQYGDIEKIVVSKAKPGGNPHQGIGVYVTFTRKQDAATCINAVDGSANGDRVLRAQYGTTKYCSSFLRNEQCNNRNCTFLHETGEDSESYTRSDLSSMNTLSSQRSNHPPQTSNPRPTQPIAQQMRRQPSKDDSISGRQSVPDGPALPSSASWANKDVNATIRTRRTSLTGSQASQSPRPASVSIATATEEAKRSERPSPVVQDSQRASLSEARSPTIRPRPRDTKSASEIAWENVLKDFMSPDFRFSFSTADIPADELKVIQSYPSFIDPYGGVKRRAMREKAEQERIKREQELLQSVATEEDSREAGSLQLGGEPEDSNPPQGRQTRESHGAIQPPSSQQGTADNSTVGSPVSATSHQFQGLNLAGRSLTPLQQQQLMLLKSAGNQQTGLSDSLNSAALDQAAQVRHGLLQSQMAQFNALQAQSRQSSRFPLSEGGTKNISNARMLSQMQSGTPNPLSAPSPQHNLASGFYASGVQGPPPGLKTAGTPPISGGGMFAQGHGFTANANLGLGGNVGKQDATPELMRELLRGRSGTNVGGLQGQEAAKLNEDFPPLATPSKESQPVDTFGFLKSQLPSESTGRVGTPTLPPGLPLPHVHPSSAAFQEQLSSSKPSSPAPILPPGLSRTISPSGTSSQRNASPSRSMTPEAVPRTRDASQISLGSPVAKSSNKARMSNKLDMTDGIEDKRSTPNSDGNPHIGVKPSPVVLNTTLAQETTPAKPERAASGTFASVAGSTSAVGSRPNTPLTAASRVSDTSIPRQPRILRVVETPKPEASAPVNTAPSAAGGEKSRSRRQSLSSNSHPDTPADVGSEIDFDASTTASRANSPPPTRIGSAPVRSVTKSQAKKDRRQKAKEAEAKKAETAPAAEEPVQAPIIGRKRKTKKAPTATSESADATASTPSEVVSPANATSSSNKPEAKPDPPKKSSEKEQPPLEAKATPPKEGPPSSQKAIPEEAWRSHNTAEQLVKDAEETGRSIKDLFVERTKPLHQLLAEMHKSGDIDLNKSSLFNPANLGQRTDMKCTSGDYDLLKQPTKLTDEHRKTLLRGQPVRAGCDELKNRVLITPRGCVLRHLESEEEQRYLDLEKRRNGAVDPFVVGDDSSNINGGLEALFATPEKFNICWIDDDQTRMGSTSPASTLDTTDAVIPPNVISAMEADSTRSHDWAVAHSAELLQTTTAAVRSFAAATAKQMLGTAALPGSNPSLDDVAAMTNEELKGLSVKSQKDLETTRKELDSLDKKFAGLLRRNKKLQQHALSIAEDTNAGSDL